MALLKTEGIILKTFDFRTSSIIATVYTRNFGKIQGLFKGIRKDYKKFSSPLEPYSLNEIILYHGRSDLHLVSYCDLLDNFTQIRQSIEKMVCASYLAELVDKIMPAEDKNIEVFDLLLESLHKVSSSDGHTKIIPVFQIKLLSLSGFKPHLDSCVSCGSSINHESYFSNAHGGLLCKTCRTKDRLATSVLRGTVASLIHIEKSDWQRSLRLGLSLKINQELKHILNTFLEFHLSCSLKTQRFLDQNSLLCYPKNKLQGG